MISFKVVIHSVSWSISVHYLHFFLIHDTEKHSVTKFYRGTVSSGLLIVWTIFSIASADSSTQLAFSVLRNLPLWVSVIHSAVLQIFVSEVLGCFSAFATIFLYYVVVGLFIKFCGTAHTFTLTVLLAIWPLLHELLCLLFIIEHTRIMNCLHPSVICTSSFLIRS